MFVRFLYSLRFVLLLLLLVLTIVSISAVSYLRLSNARHNIIKSSTDNLRVHISQLQSDLSQYLAAGEFDTARERLLLAALLPNVRALLVTDNQDKVLLGSRRIWRNLQAGEVRPHYDVALAEDSRSSRTYRHIVLDDRATPEILLIAYHAVRIDNQDPGRIRPDLIGNLYVEYDLAPLIAQARKDALREAASFAILSFGSIMIFGFFLHRSVTSRIISLANFTRFLQSRSLRERYQVRGRDEISQLEMAFNAMLENRESIERQLKQSKESAEKANRSKSIFLTQMSHEIRTPINSVIGMASLLVSTPLSIQQRQYTDIINSSAETLRMLIEDILDISKIEAEKLETVDVDFDLRQVVEEIIEIVAFKAHQKNLDLGYMFEPGLPTELTGDAYRLRQILLNLCGNAVKFTQFGDVSLHVNVMREFGDEALLHFSVRDTGVGIPDNKKDCLFDAFTQVEASGSPSCEGTGLGLYISKRLTELMRGQIGFESNFGQGTNFWVSLPFKLRYSQVVALSPLLAGMHALIIDDHHISRMSLRALLQSQGVLCIEAGDVGSALSKIAHHYRTFDLVFIDQGLIDPRILHLIKERSREGVMHVVRLLSLHEVAQDEKGVSFSLYKPIRMSSLEACIDVLFSGAENESETIEVSVDDSAIEVDPASFTILIVDDSKANQLLMLKYLQKLGYTAVIVDDGLAAVNALKAKEFDLVLMDCSMPVMDGFEAARAIRRGDAGESNVDIPIIALTAHAFKEYEDRCLAAGMNDFLTKPLKPADLLSVLDRWLSRIIL